MPRLWFCAPNNALNY